MGSASERGRRDLTEIFMAAVRAVEPGHLVASRLRRNGSEAAVRLDENRWLRRNGPLVVVGVGKAAAKMAAGCESVLDPRILRGMVIVPDGCAEVLSGLETMVGGHPVPDQRSARATERLCALLRSASSGPVLCLISGGASSLLVRPRPRVTLAEKIDTSRLLLGSGCSISQFNAVRKHLSTVKGGGFLRLTSARPIVTLILSDVIGDDPQTVGSGPAVPDSTTFEDAAEVFDRFALTARVPPSVRSLIAAGCRGEVPETVKPGDPEAGGVEAVVVGSNRDARAGAAREAARLGYRPIVMDEPLSGDTTTCARGWLRSAKMRIAESGDTPCCVIAGGETTVKVGGSGRGGRNCEFALALVEPIAAEPVQVLSAGTDGIDGPTDAAGAFVAGDARSRAQRHGLNADAMLADNDSYTFFDRLGDLLRTGPTGTNVMDLKLAIYPG